MSKVVALCAFVGMVLFSTFLFFLIESCNDSLTLLQSKTYRYHGICQIGPADEYTFDIKRGRGTIHNWSKLYSVEDLDTGEIDYIPIDKCLIEEYPLGN